MSLIINPFAFGGAGPPVGPVTWSGITGATESPTGKLTKTAGAGWGNCGAVSVETMAGDCRLTMYVEDYTVRFICGMGTDASCSSYNTIDYADFCNFGVDHNSYQNGSSGAGFANSGSDFVMIVIERIGSDVNYYKKHYTGSRPLPDDAGRTNFRGPSTGATGTFGVNAALFDTTLGVIDAANLIWQAI